MSRAKSWSSSVETRRKLASPRAASSTSSRARRPGSWVAMPTGQRPESQIRYCWQPMAMSAAVPTATTSAPRARALAKSGRDAQAPGDDERHALDAPRLEVAAGPVEGVDGRERRSRP
ncbi:MAG: hypothetical protein MZV64_50030 [Ignavibacteriales bacterium]|nr:hypothetical protein [Ignavibacteriales bacterium]